MLIEIDEKSIAYAFVANGAQIYLSDEGYFLVSKLICKDCGAFWYMNLTECFLCGAINPYLYTCASCGSFQSITKSSGSCTECGSSGLYMSCPNPDCISNRDENIHVEANKLGGVFNKKSGFSVAQQHCLNCGSKYHLYKNYKIYVRSVLDGHISFNSLEIEDDYISEDSYLILKYKGEDNIKYGLYNIKDIYGKDIELQDLKKNFHEIVSELYPVKNIK